MKILIASADYTPDGGGIGAFAHGLWQGLRETGCQANVLTRGTPLRIPSASETLLAVETGGTFYRSLAGLVRWYLALASQQADWIVVPTWDPVGVAATVPLLRPMLGSKIAVVFHGSDVASANGRKARLLKHVMRTSDRLVANSAFTRNLIERKHGARAATVRPAIGEPDLSIPEVNRRSMELISVGRLVHRKGHALVIEALSRLKAQYPEICYTIVGDGPERGRLELLAQSLGIAGCVEFLGQASVEEKRRRLAEAAIFVLPVLDDPTDPEGYGIAYLEAGAARLPVVATRSGGVAECVREGESGLFCEPNPAGVEHAVRTLLDRPELRCRLGEGGRRIAENSLWPMRARDLLEVLEARP